MLENEITVLQYKHKLFRDARNLSVYSNATFSLDRYYEIEYSDR